ncbi:hypothetical protein [Haloferax mucosum]|uniref:hypothetical protein n=1 Tax=Haloferax mucosum TaxID=403181 RepID=UPI0003243936|nr:hypothetical protein [Haloferax mucosum]
MSAWITSATPTVTAFYLYPERHFGMNATDQFMLAVTLLIFALLVLGALLAYI